MAQRPISILNLGAGVQSSTVALMALAGELPLPDHAIFADTGWEPQAVYEHCSRLMTRLRQGGVTCHVVSNGNIRDDTLAAGAGDRWVSMPAFTTWKNGKGRLRRQCTKEYKIVPIERKIREIIGLRPRQRWPRDHVVDQWFGISLDEFQRMRMSARPAIVNVYPLIDRRMTRADCLAWLARANEPIPVKSACLGCPFHDDKTWRSMPPEEWRDVVAVDRQLRQKRRGRGIDGEIYLHRSCVPLEDVDLSTPADHGQADMFADECTGMCGV